MLKIQYIAFYTLIRSQIRRVIKLWSQTLLPPVITTTLYFLVFGEVIGSRIQDINGFSYATYITPGLVMLSVINTVYGHVSFSVFIAKFQRHIEEILVSPTSNLVILLAFVGGGILRGLISAAMVFVVALWFVDIEVQHILFSLVVIILGCIVLALIAFINGVMAKTFDDVGWIPTFILIPLTYLGGVFYSLDLLPKLWREISYFNPIYYLISTFRYGLLNINDGHVSYNLVALGIIIVILFVVCLTMLNKGIGLRH